MIQILFNVSWNIINETIVANTTELLNVYIYF